MLLKMQRDCSLPCVGRWLTDESTQEMHASISSLHSNRLEDRGVADAGAALHEGILREVYA